jgi:hypothetical protein
MGYNVAIWLGFYGALDYALVKGNTITGYACIGIWLGHHTHNCMVKQNDLSGLGTWETQLKVLGENHRYSKNILGNTNAVLPEWFPPDPYFPAYNVAALIMNGSFFGVDPAWTRYNKLVKNDYRKCGLNEGWVIDDVTGEILSRGCVLLDPETPPDAEPGLGLEKNIVAEYLFPSGTNVCNQVWDINGQNKIYGWNMLCGDGSNFFKKPVVGQISEGAKKIAEYENAKIEKMVERQNYLVHYYAKSSANEMVTENVIPENFALKQNYPNPFNPSTTIQFDLPKDMQVKMVVYNSLGQTVATLLDQPMSAGQHKVSFNAESLPSGIYFYSIMAGEYSAVRKMILIK